MKKTTYHFVTRETFADESGPDIIYDIATLTFGEHAYKAIFFFYHGWLFSLKFCLNVGGVIHNEATIVSAMQHQYPHANLVRDVIAQKQIRAMISKAAQPWLYAVGTDFQLQVWQELLKIPVGQTMSYQTLARRLGRPNSTRAVGNANSANPIAYFIPCHRVVAHDGTLGGYLYGAECKLGLLRSEQSDS